MRTQVSAERPDGTLRRSSHSSIGTRAMAMTSAAVTGRKNSAPARKAKGKASAKPAPAIRVKAARSRSRRKAISLGSTPDAASTDSAPRRDSGVSEPPHRLMPQSPRPQWNSCLISIDNPQLTSS
jgi:hypothetical protein